MSGPGQSRDAVLIREAIRAARSPDGAQRGAEAPALHIPGYQVIREIARGGQGTVYQAIHEATERDVAIKLLPPTDRGAAGDAGRFARELAALREINHPSIVPIQDAGFVGLSPFIVMPYIEGWSLDELIAAAPPSTTDALRLFERICLAVHGMHLRGVIHRDLKPRNIIIDDGGEPHILDFGLAKLVGHGKSSPALTMAGEFLGSLPWASPEQVDGAPGDVDARADVYGLGAILFHMLTGGLPYDTSGSARAVMTRIATVPPVRPRSLRPGIDADAETIILRCLSRRREDRYQSASEVAAEVSRRLENKPIEAKRDSLLYVARKYLGRHRTLATVSAALGSAVLVSLIVAWVMFARATQAALDAGLSEQQAQESAREARLSLADSQLAQAREMRLRREMGFRQACLELVGQAATVHGSTLELRNEALANLAQVDMVRESRLQAGREAQFGRRSSTRAGSLVYGLGDKGFRVRPWIDDDGSEYQIDPPDPGDEAGWADLSPDGRYLVGAFQERFSHNVRVFGWDVAERRWLWTLPIPGQTPSMRYDFDPEGSAIAIAHPDRTIKIHRVIDGSVVRVVPIDTIVNDLRFIRIRDDERALLIADNEKPRLVIWYLATNTWAEVALARKAYVLAHSPEGTCFAVGGIDNRILVYYFDHNDPIWPTKDGVGTRLPHCVLSGHLARLTRVCFGVNGDLLVSCADDSTTRYWDVQRGIERFAPAINTTVIGADGDRVVIADEAAGEVSQWGLEPSAICRTFLAGGGVPAFIDERWVASGGGSGVSIWDAETGARLAWLSKKRVTAVHVSPRMLLAATTEGIERWSIEHTPQGPSFLGPEHIHENAWLDMCVAPDLSVAFLATEDNQLWRVPLEGQGPATHFAEQLGARPNAFSPDGKRVAVGNWRGSEVVVYSVVDGGRLHTFPAPGATQAVCAFTPVRADGGSLLIIGTDESYHFLDATTYDERHSIPRHGWLVSLAISRDGEMAAITRSGRAPTLINLRTFEVRADLTLPEPNATLSRAAFSPSGRTLVMTTNVGETFVWDLTEMRLQLRRLGLDWP